MQQTLSVAQKQAIQQFARYPDPNGISRATIRTLQQSGLIEVTIGGWKLTRGGWLAHDMIGGR